MPIVREAMPEIRQVRFRQLLERAGFALRRRSLDGTALARFRQRSPMLDRDKIVAMLKRRFPGSSSEQVAAAANAITGLADEWVEVPAPEGGWATACSRGCALGQAGSDDEVRVFRRGSSVDGDR